RAGCAQTAHLVRKPRSPDLACPPPLFRELPDLEQRSMRVVMAEPIPFECVVRGYISGSGWKDYQRSGSIAGAPLPSGLRESARLPDPIFTPSTQASAGHAEHLSRAELANRAGRELAETLERLSLSLYRFGTERALTS